MEKARPADAGQALDRHIDDAPESIHGIKQWIRCA
jgi:hypothetical protein